MKPAIVLAFLLMLPLFCFSQRQNDNWCFGDGGGIKFNPNATYTTFTSKMSSSETAATLSDRNTGSLLFYTDGEDIWDAQHNIMSNGKGAGYVKFTTSKQGAVIVPFVGSVNKYYVFTVEHSSGVTSSSINRGRLGYSVVDMSKNQYRGEVLNDQKLVEIDSGFSEAMTAVNDDCGDIWLLAYRRRTNAIYAYKITASGISNSPVISTIPQSRIGVGLMGMKVSPDRKRVCVDNQDMYGGYLSLHDFDVYTGRVSNLKLISEESYNGCEFSPDSKKLYAIKGGDIYQYDLSSAHTGLIKASATLIFSGDFLSAFQMAPDSNIYFAANRSTYLHRISNCNAAAPGCTVTKNVIYLGSNIVRLGLPQAIVFPVNNAKTTTTSRRDTTMCMTEPIIIIGPSNKLSYQWQDGNASQGYKVRQPGVYWVRSFAHSCVERVDTTVVSSISFDTGLPDDTAICDGDAVVLQIKKQPFGTSFSWNTGAISDAITISQKGIYTATLNYKNCSFTDEVEVSYVPKPNLDLGSDTQLCKNTWLVLPQAGTPSVWNKYRWSTGSTDSSITIYQPGVYTVKIEGRCGDIVHDTIRVGRRDCHLFFPSAFSPNNDGRNDRARLIGDVGKLKDYKLRIFNRWGELVFYTNDVYSGWDGYYKGVEAEVGVYLYQIQYKGEGRDELLKGNIMLVR